MIHVYTGATISEATGYVGNFTTKVVSNRGIAEIKHGATAQLVYVSPQASTGATGVESTLRFLLSAKSAYVDGQVIRVGPQDTADSSIDWARPLDLPVVVVPGADHFFHRRLHVIRDVITRAWRH